MHLQSTVPLRSLPVLAYLQSNMLYLAEQEFDELKDNRKALIFLTAQRHSPTTIPVPIAWAYFRPPIRLAGLSIWETMLYHF